MWFTLAQLAVYLVMLTSRRGGAWSPCASRSGIFRWGVVATSYRRAARPPRRPDAASSSSTPARRPAGLAALLGLGFAVLEAAGAIGVAGGAGGRAGRGRRARRVRRWSCGCCSRSCGTTACGSPPGSRSRPARSRVRLLAPPAEARAGAGRSLSGWPARPLSSPRAAAARSRPPRSSAAASARCCASRPPGAASSSSTTTGSGRRATRRWTATMWNASARGLRRPGRLPRAQLRRRRAGGHGPARRRPPGPHHLRRRLPRQPRRGPADPPGPRRDGHVLPRHRVPRPLTACVVGRGRLDGAHERPRRASASTGSRSPSTCPTAPRRWPRSWTARRRCPAADLDGFLDRVALATGTGRAPAAAADGQWMTWPMARELLAAGMTVGGHTVSHPILANLDADAQRAEITGCRARLHAELGIPMRWFSYPNGDRGSFDARTRALLAEAGVERAFSFDGGFVRRGAPWDPYDVPRIARRPADRRRRVRRDRDAPAGVHPTDGREPGMTARRVRAALGASPPRPRSAGAVGQEASVRARDRRRPRPRRVRCASTSTRTPIGGPCDDQRPATAAASAADPVVQPRPRGGRGAVGRDRPRAPRLLPAPVDPGRASLALRDDPLGPGRDRDAHRLHRDELELLALPGAALRGPEQPDLHGQRPHRHDRQRPHGVDPGPPEHRHPLHRQQASTTSPARPASRPTASASGS